MSRRASVKSLALVLLLLPVSSAFAQFGNVVFPSRGHNPPPGRGFGNVVFPATGRPVTHPFSISDPRFASRLGGIVSGFNPYTGGSRHHGRGNVVYLPYAYPVYNGGPSYPQQPNVVVIYPPPQPPVVINQNFAPPQPAEPPAPETPPAPAEPATSVYQAPTPSQPESGSANSSYYLLAFKDNSIYSAVAYWVDGDTLHYFTSGNRHNQASVSLLDRELTTRLNRERGSDIRLPQ
jgi:hypothetical protein